MEHYLPWVEPLWDDERFPNPVEVGPLANPEDADPDVDVRLVLEKVLEKRFPNPEEVGPFANPEDAEARLDELADKANQEHRAVEDSARDGVFHAIRAGSALLAAKRLCKHGTWLQWLEQHFTASIRTANVYMKVALYYRHSQHVANIPLRSLRETIRYIHNEQLDEVPSKPKEKTGEVPEPTNGRGEQKRKWPWVTAIGMEKLSMIVRKAEEVHRSASRIAEVAKEAARTAEFAKAQLKQHKVTTVDALPPEVRTEVLEQLGEEVLYRWTELAESIRHALKLVAPVKITLGKSHKVTPKILKHR